MSKFSAKNKINISDLTKMKGKEKIVCLTAYSHRGAQLIDSACDVILVGDSLGMTVYGMESTLGVTLDMMINHGKAVTKAAEHSFVIVDMPYGSYQKSKKQAFENCARVMAETGCDAVKLECSKGMEGTVEFLSDRGIPVMAHIGLMPQMVHLYGGFKYQGKDKNSQKEILETAKHLEECGAFSLLIEATEKNLADKITAAVKIPTIGIGASYNCDGQVLVTDDILGMFDFNAKFVKNYADLKDEITKAAHAYRDDVKAKKFPGDENCYIK